MKASDSPIVYIHQGTPGGPPPIMKDKLSKQNRKIELSPEVTQMLQTL